MELLRLSKLLEIKMEKYKLSRSLPHNKILDYITALDEDHDGFGVFQGSCHHQAELSGL